MESPEPTRRGFLGGLLVALAAPAIVRTPGLLMPVKPVLPTWQSYSLGYTVRRPPLLLMPGYQVKEFLGAGYAWFELDEVGCLFHGAEPVNS